jgi:hypothetical protein
MNFTHKEEKIRHVILSAAKDLQALAGESSGTRDPSLRSG